MKVGNSMVVEIDFTLKNSKGEIIDNTDAGKPLAYLHGAGNIIEGLEDALDELQVGSHFDIEIPPKKAHGVRDIHLINEVPKENFPKDLNLKVGEEFVIKSPKGTKAIHIKEIRENTVLVDGNHELAGQTLHYSGKIVSIREATENELKHGYINTNCCHESNCCSAKK